MLGYRPLRAYLHGISIDFACNRTSTEPSAQKRQLRAFDKGLLRFKSSNNRDELLMHTDHTDGPLNFSLPKTLLNESSQRLVIADRKKNFQIF